MANKFEEVLRLIIDSGGSVEDVGGLIKQLEALEAVSKEGSAQTIALVEKLKTLATTAAQINAYTRLKGEITETSAAIAKESEKLTQLQSEITAAEKPTAAMTRAVDKSKAALEELLNTQNRQSVELRKTSGALTKAGVDTNKLAEASAKLHGQIGTTNQQLANAAHNAGNASSGVGKLGSVATSAAEQLSGLALRLGGVAVAAALAYKAFEEGKQFVEDGIKSAEDLEEAQAKAGAVVSATADQMKQLGQAAEEAADKTAFSVREATDELTALERASGSASDAIAELIPTLNLAKAAGTDVAAAADLMVQTLAEFHLGADQAAHVADLLAKGAKSGGLELAGLSEELAKTAPFAHQLGLTIEQTVAIMAALAKEGIRGRVAAGGLKDAFSELADPTSKFSEKLRGLGIQTTDFNEVIAELAKHSDRAGEAIQTLSKNAQPAIAALVADSGAKIKEMQQGLQDAAGSAAKTAEQMDATFKGAFHEASKAFEKFQEDLLAPVLAPLSDELRELAKEFDAFAKSPDFAELQKQLKDLFVEGAKAAKELFEAIDFKALAKNLSEFVGDATKSIALFRKNLGGIIETVKLVYEAFHFAFDLIKSAILLLATALAKVVEGVAKVGEKLQELQNFDPTGLRHKFGLVNDAAVDTYKQIGDGAHAAAEALKKQLGDSIGGTVDSLDTLLQHAQDMHDGTTKALDGVSTSAKLTAKQIAEIPPPAAEATQALNATADAADRAAGAQARARKETEDYQAALHDLGIASQQDLVDTAYASSAALALLTQRYREGKTSIEELRRAYDAYATAQRAAVANSDTWKKQEVENALAVQRQLLGLADAGKEAGDAVASGANEGANALRDEAAAAADAAHATSKAADEADKASDNTDKLSDSTNTLSISMGKLSEEAAKAYQSLNRTIAGDADMTLWVHDFNRLTGLVNQQQHAVQKLNDSLDDQLAKFDPLTDKVKKLQEQFGYVAPDALHALAEKQQRVEEEQRRQAEEAQRVRDEQARKVADATRKAQDSARAPSGFSSAGPSVSADGVTRHEFTFKFDLPPGIGSLTHTQIDHLIQQILNRLRQEMSVMQRR